MENGALELYRNPAPRQRRREDHGPPDAPARGEWITFLDEADTVEPDHVALLMQKWQAG